MRARSAGVSLTDLANPTLLGPYAEYGVPELEAEEQLGPATFDRWAVRGWLEAEAEEQAK